MANRQARYKVGDVIGEQYKVYEVHMGGMGEVYLCLGKDRIPFALKTFQGTSPNLRDLFEKEVKTWVDLGKHPNIVQCYWMQVFDNIPFMGLAWISGDESRGTDLRGWLRHGALDLKQALKFAIDIVRGLVYAGEKSDKPIVHRDLKPDNVLVAQGGLAKITDFGLATIIEKAGLADTGDNNDEFDTGKSRYAGNVVGTPAYMPPEQWRGDADIDLRADIYAVGCILYEMLTGRMPYVASTISQMRLQHLEAPIPTLTGLPAEINTIIGKCMAKNRADRYPTMTALLEALTYFYQMHIDEILSSVQIQEMTEVDYVNRGATYEKLKLYDLAIADFDKAIELNPTLVEAYFNRGNSYGALGQRERAIADYDEAIRLDPKYAIAYSNRGVIYGDIGQRERAIADYDEAIRLDPKYATVYYNRGVIYGDIGQRERAIADYDEAIRLDPKYATAYYNRGVIYGDIGQRERAIADYDEAIRLDPTLAQAWFNKGAVYANIGRLQEALACFERAYQLGDSTASGAIQHVKQMMGNTTIPVPQNDPQVAFEAFQRVTSLDAMRHVVAQYPILKDMIQTIQKTIQTQVPPELKPEFETRLAWLIQIAKGD